MKIWVVVAVGLVGLVQNAMAWKHATTAQFQSALKKNDMILVAFVAPWTESSKSLDPEWVSAAMKSKTPLISIDCVAQSKLCEEHNIISYPAIRLIQGERRVTKYRGPRKASSIVRFILRSERPVLSVLDENNLGKFKTIDDAIFIAYTNSKNGALESSFRTLAARNRDRFSFGVVSNELAIEEKGFPLGCVVRYKVGDETVSVCENSRLDILQEFVEQSTAPLIGEMTRRNELKYLQAGKSLVYIFALTERERDGYRTEFMPLAKKYQEYLNFVIIDAVEYASMAPGLGLKSGIYPALAVQNPMLGQVFPFDQKRKITPDAAESFVLEIVRGKAKPAGSDGGQLVHEEL